MTDLYRFGPFLLDPRRRTLTRAGSPVSLTPKAFDVLLFLVQNPSRLVTKEELLQAVWGDTFVEEGNLTQYISHLRKALGDNAEDMRLIVTIARKGYQFTETVSVAQTGDTPSQAPVQVPSTDRSRGDARSAKAPPHWWRASLVVASPVVLVVAGYLSWQHYRAPEPPRSQRLTLAVLPFQNLTGDPNKEYLADGLTEEMILQLARATQGQLGVIARTSVMRYKSKDERLDQIGRDLSVQYVLENSLRESGDHLRLTTQLVQVKDQTHLWSQDYDYPAKDILGVEDDVARAVAQEIRLRLTSQTQTGLVRSDPIKPEAFDAYLQGFYYFQRNTNADSDMAALHYQRAIQLDPSYALPWVGLSRIRNWQVNIGLLPAEEGHRLARQAVEQALALSPNLAPAHTQMGRLKQQVDLDWAGADASFHRAMALEPGNSEGMRMAAGSAALLGRFDEALQLSRRSAGLDPLNAESWECLAEIEYLMGQMEHAAADARKAMDMGPDVWPGPILLSQIYVMQGRAQDALTEIERVRFEPQRAFLYPIAYHALGRHAESDAALKDLISKYPGFEYEIAEVHAFRNQSDEAFEWLNRAYAHRDSGLIGTKVDPLLNNLRHDPRYAALLKKLNFSPSAP